jgi:hypothetical protein
VALDRSQILALVDEGLAAAPLPYAPDVRIRLRRMAAEGVLRASSRSQESLQLASAIAPFAPLIRPAAIEALAARDVASVPLPVCNAIAKIQAGRECVFVFDGLLDAAAANVAMSHAVENLPAAFDTTFPQSDYPTVSARAWVGVILGWLINRFLTHAEGLPDFRILIAPPARDTEIRHAFMGAAWWILLHELGHLTLGHTLLAASSSRPAISKDLVVTQALSPFQLQEFDADEFAFHCLTDTGKKLAYGWANYALGPSMMLETLASCLGETHPLSVNRLERARELAEDVDAISDEIGARTHLQRHGSAYTSISQEHGRIRATGREPLFADWPPEALLTALGGLHELFDAADIELDRFLASSGFGWRSVGS